MRKICPCDLDGVCPYNAQYINDCEYYCPEDYECTESEPDELDYLDFDVLDY